MCPSSQASVIVVCGRYATRLKAVVAVAPRQNSPVAEPWQSHTQPVSAKSAMVPSAN
jgi:hypothetical protein